MTIIKFIELKTIKTPKHQENGNKANNKFGELSIGTSLLNSVSFLSQQMEDMETRRKAFMKELWGDVTLFDLIGRSGASANRQTYSSSSTFGFTPLYVNTPDALVQNYYAFRAALFFANEEYKIDLQTRGSVLFREVLIESTYLNNSEGWDLTAFGIHHEDIDFTISVVGGIQNVFNYAAESSSVISKAAAKRITFIGVGYTAIDIFHAKQTANLNTSHYIDGTITFVLAGIAIFNPVGLTALTIYGGARLVGGAIFDDWINRQFPKE